MESVKKVTSPAVNEIFSSMEYGPAPESDKIAARNSHSHGQRWSFTCTLYSDSDENEPCLTFTLFSAR